MDQEKFLPRRSMSLDEVFFLEAPEVGCQILPSFHSEVAGNLFLCGIADAVFARAQNQINQHTNFGWCQIPENLPEDNRQGNKALAAGIKYDPFCLWKIILPVSQVLGYFRRAISLLFRNHYVALL
ncbi:MAG: hypothetical protein HY313_11570 [Acidobacteria bacterium]|nr:hypothetical protein [Acidobacteriota bacterium]